MPEEQSAEKQVTDYISEIYKICTTLSSEAIGAAESRARSNNFDVDRGDVTFAELTINLGSARETLKDAIEKKKLIQLPLTIQKRLHSNLTQVSEALQGLMSNADQIVNLGTAVEALNTAIWQYGLHNLSDQVLGHQTKLNQLKQQDVRVKQLLETIEIGRSKAEELVVAASTAATNTLKIEGLRKEAEQSVATLSVARERAADDAAKIGQLSAVAQQGEAQATRSNATAKLSTENVATLEGKIRTFFDDIDAYTIKMKAATDEATAFLTDSDAAVAKALKIHSSTVTDEIKRLTEAAEIVEESQALELATHLKSGETKLDQLLAGFTQKESSRLVEARKAASDQLEDEEANHSAFLLKADSKLEELEAGLKGRSEETIEANHMQIVALVKELAELKEKVKDQVAQATGLGQFGAFQSRQNTVSKGKYLWVGTIGGLVAIVVGLTYFIALHAQQGDLHSAAFWIKLSMNVPLGFLIGFCTVQYNRERRLEEEYAFKASISVSLTPYREMIYSILEKDGSLADGTYTSFVVDAVRNVFTSPTEKIFDSPKKMEGLSEKSLKATAELIGTVVKASK